ncbi:MAG TPA: efflux RND transporter periplasmic adaptor subunit [Bacteroidetes bacterium]|nr:MAG: efflux transporter periplasmic adaptor subunit [Ignavibacteria bacterium GWC2_56_12]HAV22089.1 efflux RND transporter periplasmic adaptor subunit [Bacteroidota bacterium]
MKKRLVLSGAAVVVVGGAAYFFLGTSSSGSDEVLAKVKVQRATIVDKALAVGTIEPEFEISVKSKISGVVSRIFTDVGVYVKAGQPLLEVKPDPTPLELADAKRQVQLNQVEMDNVKKEMVRKEQLHKSGLISDKEWEDFTQLYEGSELRLKITKERLALIESGRVKIDDTQIESIIKAPIDGYVLSRSVEVGDPVTPLTTYQEGTVLMKMANMERLIFKGTVDEIDVGKMKEGMETEIKVGALPNDTVRGTLRKIWLKAEKKENATVFPIEILIPAGSKSTLRAGYSANANIIIQRKADVLAVPERVVTFRNDSAFVQVPKGALEKEEKLIRTGLSDAINVEVLNGLAEGEEVYEKPVKKIE